MIELLTQGVGGTEYVHTVARVGLGVFFALSGQFKLRDPTNILATFRADGIPFIGFNRWFVPGVELSAGLALIVGALTPLAAMGLLAICCVATVTDGMKRFQRQEPWADWIDDVLYLPEVIYVGLLLYLIAAGAGPLSIDAAVQGLL